MRFPPQSLILALTTACLTARPAPGEDSPWLERFNALWSSAQAAEQQQDWEGAARSYQAVIDLSRERELVGWDIYRALARCEARRRRADQAMEGLRAAVELGLNDADGLLADAVFSDLREDDRFTDIVFLARKIDSERILIHAPEKLDKKKPAPLVIFFHGLGENPHQQLPFWRKVAEKLRLIVAIPRGVNRRTMVNSNFNTWHEASAEWRTNTSDIDAPACLAIVDEAIQSAKKEYTVRDDRIILVGYSQGGGVALRLLSEHPDRFCGAVALGPLYKPTGVEIWKGAALKKCRVWLMAGELDKLDENCAKAENDLAKAGVAVKRVRFPGVGHEPPGDYFARQVDALRFVLRLQRRKPANRSVAPKPE